MSVLLLGFQCREVRVLPTQSYVFEGIHGRKHDIDAKGDLEGTMDHGTMDEREAGERDMRTRGSARQADVMMTLSGRRTCAYLQRIPL